jgi:tetratricopeptide (TPR) repeat protein
MNHGTADTLYGLGYWLLDQRRYDDAKHVFRTMLLLAPSDDRGWLALGMSHEGANEDATAVRLYRLGREACRGSIRCAIALGRVLRKLGRDDEATAAYAEAGVLADERDEIALGALVSLEAGA